MQSKPVSINTTYYQRAAWYAIASGISGIIAVGFLIAYLVFRSADTEYGMLMGKIHDAVVIVQALLLIPVLKALHKLSQQNSSALSNSLLITGIVALSVTALFLFLGLIKILAVVVYMFPQGIFGVCLIVICWRMKGILSNGLRWFGIVVGFGLALVGCFPLYYAIFVDPIMLHIPAAPDEVVAKIPISPANMIIHQVLWIGSPLGVLTLPFWTILAGVRLFKNESRIK